MDFNYYNLNKSEKIEIPCHSVTGSRLLSV